MDLTNKTFAPLRVFIDEFVRLGLRHAVTSPGSRNAPISYSLADRPELKTWSVIDERSAGFFALGIAKSTRRPVVVTCTSGTAAANLLPAVVEASHAGLPLLVLSADRPPELRDVGAGQAIDQIKIYGDAVRWFVEAGNHNLSEQTLRHFRALGCRAWSESLGVNPGPVHVNLPLREPLAPIDERLDPSSFGIAATGRGDGEPWTRLIECGVGPLPEITGDLADALAHAKRPLIVAGEQHQVGLCDRVVRFAGSIGAPILGDALSHARRDQYSTIASVVCAFDLILRDPAVREHLAPDLVLRVGELPTSKPLRTWLDQLDCRQIVIDPRRTWREATRLATTIIAADPVATISILSDSLGDEAAPPEWSQCWRDLELAAQAAIDLALSNEPFPFEPEVYRSLARGLTEGATIYVSSSMPIRDVESFVGAGRPDLRFLSNRGANGIDGVVSSALGAAVTYGCDRVILLIGDVALLHDIGALALIKRHGIEITIVCVDNDGGGIFSFLPLADHESHFEQQIATPTGVDIAAVAQAFGLDYTAPADADQLASALKRPGFVHLHTDRSENRAGHSRVAAAVTAAVGRTLTAIANE